MTDSNCTFLGIDVGGTNVKLGIVNDSGLVLAQTSFPTEQHRGPQYMIDQSRDAVDMMLKKHPELAGTLVGAGLGTPGTMDIPQGMILEPPNMPGWRHFPIRNALSRSLQLPVTYANDANAAAFGEFWVGSGRDHASMVLFTLGTGVGGGIIIDNQLVSGAHSLGGEVGHIVVDTSPQARICGCGRSGHLEAYASATGLVARTIEQLSQFPSSQLLKIGLESITAKSIHLAAEVGDPLALQMIEETADYLARGIAMLCHVLDPAAFMIGGAMTFGQKQTNVGRRFLQRVCDQVAEQVFPSISKNLAIDYATLGGDAGFIGAAGLARKNHLNI